MVLGLGKHEFTVLDLTGGSEVVARVESFPMRIDLLPDGRLIVVDSAQARLPRREPDGTLVTHADLSVVTRKPWNDIVVDGRGRAYVNTIGFDFPQEEFARGAVVLVDAEGQVRPVAADLASVDLDRGAFACVLSRGKDPRLFVVGQEWEAEGVAEPSGQIVAFPAPRPGRRLALTRACGQRSRAPSKRGTVAGWSRRTRRSPATTS